MKTETKIALLAYLPGLLLITMLCILPGCSVTNPVAVAQTPSQKLYAVEAVYNAVLAEAVEFENEAEGDDAAVLTALIDTTVPVMDSLNQAHAEYQGAKQELMELKADPASTEGDVTEASDLLTVLSINLERWITRGSEVVLQLREAFK